MVGPPTGGHIHQLLLVRVYNKEYMITWVVFLWSSMYTSLIWFDLQLLSHACTLGYIMCAKWFPLCHCWARKMQELAHIDEWWMHIVILWCSDYPPRLDQEDRFLVVNHTTSMFRTTSPAEFFTRWQPTLELPAPLTQRQVTSSCCDCCIVYCHMLRLDHRWWCSCEVHNQFGYASVLLVPQVTIAHNISPKGVWHSKLKPWPSSKINDATTNYIIPKRLRLAPHECAEQTCLTILIGSARRANINLTATDCKLRLNHQTTVL